MFDLHFSYCALQLYEEIFEQKFIAETGKFYQQESLKLLDECNCSDYMERVSLVLVQTQGTGLNIWIR